MLGPMQGVRVLELARILAGPWAGQVFADLGADVLKVESPAGDDTRKWGPPFIENAKGARDAAYFHACNRGKRSTVVDFSRPEGQETVIALASEADVLIENFKVGGLKKYGLNYEALSKHNPKLIYCSISGFGQTGPYANRPGYDFIVQGMSGIMDITGDPAGPPQKIGVAYADIFTGLYSVIAIQAALAHREHSGRGQHIDMALLDSIVGTLANQGMNYLASGQPPSRLGNTHPNISPYETIPCTDGWIVLAVGNNAQFGRFCDLVGLQALVQDKRFVTNEKRVEHRTELSGLIGSATQTWSANRLLGALEEVSVPAGPINSLDKVFSDPQVVHRGMQLDCESQPGAETVPGIASPMRFSDIDFNNTQASPDLGEHEASWL
jgi:crotonobetainyl-CoA:carnitine CoA-transferase CaiB-like acyl-CoA transferase